MLNLNYEPLVLVDNIKKLSVDEWLDWRRTGYGGSDVAAAMGISPWKTARDLYYEKRGIEPAVPDDRNWVAKEVGHRLESLVAEIYQKRTGYKVYAIRRMFQHPFYPFLIADVDFFVEKPNGQRGILEVKTSHYQMQDAWANDGIPIYYELQGRRYCCVANVDFAAFACLFGGSEFIMREVDRDLDQEESTIQFLSQFHSQYILAGVEPPYTEAPDWRWIASAGITGLPR